MDNIFKPPLCIVTKDKYDILINNISIYQTTNPQQEIYNDLKTHPIDIHEGIIIVFGYDCGNTAKNLLKLYTNTIILILEPNLNLFYKNNIIVNSRLYIFDNIIALVKKAQDVYTGKSNVHCLVSLHWDKLYKIDYIETVIQDLQIHLNNIHTVSNIQKRKPQWVTNIIRNLSNLNSTSDIKYLKNICKNKPIIICSPGPSLDKNIHLLKEIQNDIIIIGVNASYSILRSNGIKPHIVVSVESFDLSSFFDNDMSDTILVMPYCANPSLRTLNFKKTFLFAPHSSFYATWAQKQLKETLTFSTGNSVACTAFSLAVVMGANPIILIGQDLAFSDNKIYASGSNVVVSSLNIDLEKGIYTKDINKNIYTPEELESAGTEETQDIFYIKGHNNTRVISRSDYVLFLSWFVQSAKNLKQTMPELHLINSTEGGAYIEGFNHTPLASILQKVNLQPTEFRDTIKQLPCANKQKRATIELHRLYKILNEKSYNLKKESLIEGFLYKNKMEKPLKGLLNLIKKELKNHYLLT